VGLVDLDWDAASLHQFFGVQPLDGVDLLHYLRPANRTITDIEKYVLEAPLGDDAVGKIFLLPTVTDSVVGDEVPFDAGVEVFLRDNLFPAFGRLYNLDYLLLDARSGVNPYANFALASSDFAVLVARGDRQNRHGMRRMVNVCRGAGRSYMLLLAACPSPKGHVSEISSCEGAVGASVDVIVPFAPELYFDEFVAARDRRHSSLARLYRDAASRMHIMLEEHA